MKALLINYLIFPSIAFGPKGKYYNIKKANKSYSLVP